MVDLCRELIFKQENVWLLYLILNDANDNKIEMIVEVKYANERQMDKSVKLSLKKNNRRFFSKEQRAAYGEKSDMKKISISTGCTRSIWRFLIRILPI